MLSQEFLIQRGYCCGHGCLMCPYEPKHTEGNTNMSSKSLEERICDLEELSHEPQNYREKCEQMEQRIEHLESILKEFMDSWGPDVQRRRAERDAVWDEMIRVLTIQKRRDA